MQLFKEAAALDPKGKIMMRQESGQRISCLEMAEYQHARTFIITFGLLEPRYLKEFIRKYPSGRLLKEAYLELSRMQQINDEEGLAFYQDMAAKFPNDPDVSNRFFEQIMRFATRPEIKEILERGIELAESARQVLASNSLPQTAQNLAHLQIFKGDPDKAGEAYGRDFLADQIKTWVNALINYAEFWLNRKRNTDDAEAAIGLALTMSPGEAGIRRSAARLYLLAPGKPEKALAIYGPEFLKTIQYSPKDLYDYFSFWIGNKANIDSAMSGLETLLRLKPESVYYRSYSAGMLLRAGYADRALAVFGPEFIALRQNDSNALYEYGDFWIQKNANLESAVSALETAARKSPRSWLRQRQTAELLVKINKLDAALAVFGPGYLPAIREDAMALSEYARFWMVDTKMNKESAMEALETAARLKSLTWMDRRTAASVFLSIGRPDRAEEIYGSGYLQTITGDAEALFRYAQFWMYSNRNLNTALEAAERACKLTKDKPDAWAVLSQLCVIHGRLEEALSAIDKACELATSKKAAEKYETSRKQIKSELEKKKK